MRRSLTFFICIITLTSLAQQYYDDAQLWAYIYLEKKITKHFDAHLKVEGRGTNNVMDLGKAWADIGLTYKANKHIKIMADYVFNQKRRSDGSYKTQHQYYAGLILKQDIRFWRFIYRNIFQSQFTNPNTSKEGYIFHYYDRNKFTIKYEIAKRLNVYVAEEIRIPLNDPQEKGINRTRSFIGTEIITGKNQQLELYFMFQAKTQYGEWYDQEDSYPPPPLKHYYIYGIGYSIAF